MLYYFVTPWDDFIINIQRGEINKVPRKQSKSLDLNVTEFNPKTMFPLFSSQIFTLKGLRALSKDELIDDIFSTSFTYEMKRRNFSQMSKVLQKWLKERADS